MKAPTYERVVVVLADQHHSRTSADRVPEALDALARLDDGLLLGFERTAGDEIQGLTDDPAVAVAAVETLSRLGSWRLGLGLGPVETPLPTSTRAARGSAYTAARAAIDVARRHGDLALVAADEVTSDVAAAAERTESALLLLRALWSRRTPQGWEVAELLDDGLSVAATAERLGITPSAVSQRARSAALEETTRGRALAVDLLAEAVR